MSWIANKVSPIDRNRETGSIELEKVILGMVRGDQFLYIHFKFDYRVGSWLLQCFSCDFSIPIHGGSFTLYSSLQTILILHLSIIQAVTRVLVPSDTLSALLWVIVAKAALFKGSSPHKCGQKVSCRVFNAVATTFLRYFLAPILPVCFNMHAPLSGVSYKVTLGGRIGIWHVLRSSEEIILLGPLFSTSLLACYL